MDTFLARASLVDEEWVVLDSAVSSTEHGDLPVVELKATQVWQAVILARQWHRDLRYRVLMAASQRRLLWLTWSAWSLW